MTQPTVVFFGPDGRRPPSRRALPKVFLRTLLFSTAKRGQILESMYVTLQSTTHKGTFGIWVYGDDTLVRGSGMHVGEDGVSCNYHFLLPDDTEYNFTPGRYTLEVYATRLGKKTSERLWSLSLEISEDVAAALATGDAGVFFDWNPQTRCYQAHADVRPQPQELPPRLTSPQLNK